MRLIKSRYVYKIKRDCTGKIVKRKSKLVALGYQKKEGVDYEETFAPVEKQTTTFRVMLALAQVHNFHIHQLDVDSAFLYAPLDEEVYMKPPLDMELSRGKCLQLLKSLYGLKQAPRN